MEEIIDNFDKAMAINNYYWDIGNETRVWLEDDMIFVCYNALTDMDEIDEVSQDWLDRTYQRIIDNQK